MTNKRIKSIILITVYILIMYVITDYVLLPFIDKILEKRYGDIFPRSVIVYSNIFLNIGVYSILLIIGYFLFHFDIKQDILYTKSNINYFIPFVAKGFLAYYLVNIIVNIITSIMSDSNTTVNQESIEIMVKYSSLSFILMILSVCIIGPIVEELVFRKAFFELINNDKIAIAVSSFLFGIIHVLTSKGTIIEMIAYTLPYFATGLIFCIMYKKSNRNIISTITLHIIINTLSIFLIVLLK